MPARCGYQTSPPRRVAAATLMLAALVLSACSARQGYEFNRSQGEQNARCDEKRTASEEAACRAAYERSFEDYQRELEALQDREDPP